jgi:hypothetical protein
VWELPAGVVDAVTNHHIPGDSRFPDFPTPATVIHMARELTDAKGSLDDARLDMAHLERVGVAHRLNRWAEIVTAE